MAFSLPFFKKKQEQTYYFGLYLTDTHLEGFVIDISQGKPVILAHKKCPLSQEFEHVLEDTDGLISDIESSSQIQLDKTIFFLHSYMIDQATHEIKESYKNIIKNLVRELELVPLGYIDVQEAIHDYVKHKSIVNSIFIELNKKELGIFIYKGGVLIHFEYTQRTKELGECIEEVLINLPGKHILPGKIFLYGEAASNETASDITQYHWKEKTFVQHPTIQQLKDEDMNDLMAASFAKEILDIAAEKKAEESQESPLAPDDDAKFGFVFGEDIAPKSRMEIAESESDSEEVSEKKSVFSFITSLITGIYQFFGSRSFAKKARGGKYFIMAGAAIILLVGIFVGFEYFFHKATVTVSLESKEAQEEIELELPVSESASKKLALLKHIKVVDYSQDKSTTGSRDVGEKAKGQVVVHNFDNTEKTISRGTKIVYKDWAFTLDSEVKVASASSSGATKEAGKKEVAVTASEIGDEYNLDKGIKFKIGDLTESLFEAEASADFTGGTKKKVKTVSKEDMDSLIETAEAEAKKKSAQILKKEIASDELIISALSDVVLSETTYSKELGEEADKVSLKASAEIEYYTVNRELLEDTLSAKLKSEDDEGYLLDSKTLSFEVSDAEMDTKQVTLLLDAKANLYRKVNIADIKKAVRFSATESISEKLEDAYNAKSAKVDKNTSIPFLSNWLPLFSKNITIITSST
jgi:hypothetical protein